MAQSLVLMVQCAQVREIRVKTAIQLPADYYVGKKSQVAQGYWEKKTPSFYDRKSVLYFFCARSCDEASEPQLDAACASVEKDMSEPRPGWITFNNHGVCKFLQGDYDNAYNHLVQAATLAQDDRVEHNLRVSAHVLQEILPVVKP